MRRYWASLLKRRGKNWWRGCIDFDTVIKRCAKRKAYCIYSIFFQALSSTLSNDHRGFIIMAWLKSLYLAPCLNISCGLALGSFWGFWFWEFHCEVVVSNTYLFALVKIPVKLVLRINQAWGIWFWFMGFHAYLLENYSPWNQQFAPENGLLEDASLLGRPIFTGACC